MDIKNTTKAIQGSFFESMGFERVPKEFLQKVSVEQRGESGRYFLIKHRPGSHQVSGDDLSDGVEGEKLVPKDLVEDYEPFEAFWLYVAAGRNPELLSQLRKSSQTITSTIDNNLEGLVQKVGDKNLQRGIDLIDHSYEDFVNSVKNGLALNKKERDIESELITAIHGYTLKQIANGYRS